MKIKLLGLLCIPLLSFSQIPTGYYDSVTGLTGYALKSKLHKIISQKTNSYNYSDIPNFYNTTDIDHYYENNGSILDIYSENPTGADAYEYNSTNVIGTATAEGQGFNREHGMPQSTFYGVYPMYSDIHFLIPADAYINQRRSNYPYARNTGNNKIFTNGSKLGNSTTPGYTNLVYEPIDEFKGDVARYLLYFVTRYEGSLHKFNYLLSTSTLDGTEEKGFANWYITMLLDWNTLDPVSQREIDRNNAIYTIENVRNPFIDHPEYVNLIWNQNPDAIAPQAPLSLSITEIGESYLKLTWQTSTQADVLGYKIYVNGVYYDSVEGKNNNFYFLDRLTASTVYNVTVRAYDNGYLVSSDSNLVTGTTLATDNLAKDLMITKYIEGTTSSTNNIYNNAIEITNKTGHPVKLNNYHLSIQFKGSNNTYYFSDTFMLEGEISPGESKVILHPYSNFPNYNLSQADFVTNATPMTYSGSQYIELSYATKYLKTVSTQNYDLSYETVDAVGFKDVTNTNGNVSLYRNTNVTDPNVNFMMTEWTSNANNYTTGLGVDVLGVLEIEKNNSIEIYPNPVIENIYATGNAIEKIKTARIFDLTGRLLLSENHPFRSKKSINIFSLKSGIYILQLDEVSFKLIKK